MFLTCHHVQPVWLARSNPYKEFDQSNSHHSHSNKFKKEQQHSLHSSQLQNNNEERETEFVKGKSK